ncbi:hypothetical protein A2160_02670 [Candidatus Beckwithbacteria bacterium RBG_13_42_9]|uniref:Dehydrogenase E1 component domain-containing protein n=1 Tax=Candidatus Beckwithbacteria bacterium RBG_13_42_9 TaxID=1797457 RepID=A0A1F5E7L3_9BACT|nr:MAG: hypothetical protein A2160_02670 [Candidatus Beckwithbacteria bacterium RBG_13_42_9]
MKTIDIARQVLRLRLSQMIVNERYKKSDFKIPIHLAFGHESIAVAINELAKKSDQLVLSHRNIHYNLARSGSLKRVLNEYYLRKSGLADGRLGSMNLANQKKNITYTSSILGNNVSVASGLALGQKVKKQKGIVIVVTGDGAIEEGSFYESLVFMKSNHLASLIIVEDNGWSLATRIEERRCHINLNQFTASLGIKFLELSNNDPYVYLKKLTSARQSTIRNKSPFCVGVKLSTLGNWNLKTAEHPLGKSINYHAGPAPTINLSDWPLIKNSAEDPVFVLKKYFSEKLLKRLAKDILESLKREVDEIH